MSLSTDAITKEYYDKWNTGDLKNIEPLLSENFHFKGPMEEHNDRMSFCQSIQKLAEDPKVGNIKVNPTSKIINGEKACYFYEFQMGNKHIPMAEYFEVHQGKIKSIRLYFDSKLFQ